MSIRPGFWFSPLLFAVLTVPLLATGASAQVMAPPIHGVTGTIALPWNVDQIYNGVGEAVAGTRDGIERITHRTKRTKAEGEAAALSQLRPGTPVVVQYTVKGIQSSNHNEGTVTSVDASRKRVSIRFADGATDTLRFSEHATSSEAHAQGGSWAILYSADESGRSVPHYFRPAGR